MCLRRLPMPLNDCRARAPAKPPEPNGIESIQINGYLEIAGRQTQRGYRNMFPAG